MVYKLPNQHRVILIAKNKVKDKVKISHEDYKYLTSILVYQEFQLQQAINELTESNSFELLALDYEEYETWKETANETQRGLNGIDWWGNNDNPSYIQQPQDFKIAIENAFNEFLIMEHLDLISSTI